MNILRCLLLLSCLGLLWGAPPGSHSLRHVHAFLSGPLLGVPQYSSVAFLDDVLITSYTTENSTVQPRTPWMENITAKDPHFWENESHRGRVWEHDHMADVRSIMEQVNQTEGIHIVQWMSSCEFRDDGSTAAVYQYAFDGHNFISFDKDRLTFTAAMDAAKITQDRWNSERLIAQRWKTYLEGRCIEYLQRYWEYGKEDLQRVAPKTRISRRKSRDHTFLTGYAYGFYPREIEVKWVRNGVEIPWESNEILPNPDGTYQVRTTVEVQEGDDEKVYKYEVYHSSLPESILLMYEEKTHPTARIIGIATGVLLVVVLLILSTIYFRKTRQAQDRDRNQGENII